MDPLKVGWHVIMSGDGGGYGHVGHELYESVRRAGAHMVGHTSFGWETLVAITPPRSAIIGIDQDRPDICFHSMFECSTIPPDWVPVLNRAGLIWVPSEFCRELFIDAGVKRPIFKVGYAVDSQIYRPKVRQEHDGPFTVLIWADSLMSRKNVLMAIKAFIAADLPDAVLEIKVSDSITPSGNFMYNGKKMENIFIYADYWHRADIVSWLHTGDVGLYLSGGEGYGLQPKEGLATGLPMIVAANTGMMEYLDPDYALLVECPTLEISPTFKAHFGLDLMTWKPDFDQVVEHLRWAYNNRSDLYAMGARAIPAVTAQTWDLVGREAYWHLYNHYKG